MSIGFAGSKNIDERRRRRLAQEGMEAPSSDSSGAPRRKSPRKSAASRKSAESTESDNSHSSDSPSSARSRLWREPWKYGVLISLLILANCGLVYHAFRATTLANEGIAATVDAITTWTVRYLPFIYCIAVSHIAWLIYYHRSRSRLDFSGRYRLWIWMATLWTVITACALCGWHERFGNWLAGKTTFREWNGPLWCWLIPAAAAMLSNTRLITEEFTRCRFAWRMHLSSLLCAALAGGCLLLQGTSIDGPWMQPTLTMSVILWPTLELGAFLLFARHVVHVSNEPATSAARRRMWRIPVADIMRKFVAWVLAPREELPAYTAELTSKPTRKKSASARTKRSTKAKSTRSKKAPSKVVTSTAVKEPPSVSAEANSAKVQNSAPVAVPKKTEPLATQQSSQAASVPADAKESEAQSTQTRPAPQLRSDPPQKVKGPNFAAREDREPERVLVAKKEKFSEDDFGDVEGWGDEEQDEPRRKRMKGKKKRRR